MYLNLLAIPSPGIEPKRPKILEVLSMVVVLPILACLVAVVALGRAFADRRRMLRTLDSLHERVKQAERTVRQHGNLANEIAHEIKNPITAILCSAETLELLLSDKLSDDHKKSLGYIRDYGDQLLRLVSDFIDLNRFEAGHTHAKPENVEIEPIVDSILGLLASPAMRKNITLRRQDIQSSLLAQVDPKHFKQVLFNLVHNALKFTPENGVVEVDVVEDKQLKQVRISVSDNGPGIPPKEIERLFDLYARYEGQGHNYDAGSGIGLALCRSLVRLAGGELSVTSEPYRGSVFTFTLPLGIAKSTSASKKLTPAVEKPLIGQHFLVIDADPGTREAVSRLIEAWGGMVDRVSEAADAVKKVSEVDYDAVMLDSDYDIEANQALLRTLRDELSETDTKLIVAAGDEVEEDKARACGADICVEKPLNGKVLLNSLVKSGKYSVTH